MEGGFFKVRDGLGMGDGLRAVDVRRRMTVDLGEQNLEETVGTQDVILGKI
jgi:hypothetical protein